MPGQIIIKNPILGGVADSKYLGIANSVAKMVGIDIHSEPGVIKANQRLKKDSGSTITEFVKNTVVCSNGETYFFSADSGKVWRRSSAGAYSLAYTTAPAAGGAACLGAREYQGYVYWATESRLHRISTANALVATWVTLDLNFQTFTKTDASYHPLSEQNLVLYAGDGNQLASYDGATFTAAALDVKVPLRIASLGRYITDLLLGTFAGATVNDTELVRWNTWSPSFSSSDEVPDIGIFNFLATDNIVVVAAGSKGNLYYFNGSQLERYKHVPGDYTKTKASIIYPDASVSRFGLPLFGVSNVSGNPSDCGIWSLGSFGKEYPVVLNLEYPISTGKIANVEIGSVAMCGDYLLVTWKDSNSTPIYGVDIIDFSNKQGAMTVGSDTVAGAFFDTRVIDDTRERAKTFKIDLAYRILPTGTAITVFKKVNHGSWEAVVLRNDADKKEYVGEVKVPDANTVEFRTVLTASGDNAPEMESLIITW